MKTLHQKRVEALERRRNDLETLNALFQRVSAAIANLVPLQSFRYNNWVLTVDNVTGAPPMSNRSLRLVIGGYGYDESKPLYAWFVGKINAATRDIESLEKILGGSNG